MLRNKSVQKITATFFALLVTALGAYFFFYNTEPLFADKSGNVHGYMWGGVDNGTSTGAGIGWVSLNCIDSGNCGTSAYAVNIEPNGAFTGHAWSDTIGWISFEAADVSGCPIAPCDPSVDLVTGQVSGWVRAISVSRSGIDSKNGGWNGWIRLSDGKVTSSTSSAISYHPSPKADGTRGSTLVTTDPKNHQALVGYAFGGAYNDIKSAVVGWLKFTGAYADLGGSSDLMIEATPSTVAVNGLVAVRYFSPTHVNYKSCTATDSENPNTTWTATLAQNYLNTTNTTNSASTPWSTTKSGVTTSSTPKTISYTVTCTNEATGQIESKSASVVVSDKISTIELTGILNISRNGANSNNNYQTSAGDKDTTIELTWSSKNSGVDYKSCKGISTPPGAFDSFPQNKTLAGLGSLTSSNSWQDSLAGVMVLPKTDGRNSVYQIECLSSITNLPVKSNIVTIFPFTLMSSVNIGGPSCVLSSPVNVKLSIKAPGYDSCTVSGTLSPIRLDSNGFGLAPVTVTAAQNSAQTFTVTCRDFSSQTISATKTITVDATCSDPQGTGGNIIYEEQ